jgi:hypothetical protein
MEAQRDRVSVLATGVLLAVLLLHSQPARADGISFSAQPSFGWSSTTSSFADGTRSTSEASTFGHTYRLGLSQSIYPHLSVNAGGTFDQQIGWVAIPGPASRNDTFNWTGFAGLTFGDDVIGGGFGYDHQSQWSASRFAGQFSQSPTLARDGLNASLHWAPADLPKFTLNASRSDSYDLGRTFVDQQTDAASLTAAYTPVKNLDLSYSLGWTRPEDHLTGTITNTISNTARASYGGSYLADRGTYFASYGVTSASSDTTAGETGLVTTPVFPTGGLSAVETFPADARTITLDPNPALIDANLASGAAVDLGFALSAAGDVRPREMGFETAFPFPAVSRIFVWVSQQLPFSVANAFSWTAYQSDDNLHWKEIPISPPVAFGLLDNRFEITIPRTHSKFFKVVTRPLPVGFTTDARYASILVTEIQAQDLTTVVGHVRTSNSSGDLLATTRIAILQGRESLAFDSTARVAQPGPVQTWSYNFVNGLSYGQPLGKDARMSSRFERSDFYAPSGHLATNRLSGNVTHQPIPAVQNSAAASAEVREAGAGYARNVATTLTNRTQFLPTLGLSDAFSYGVTIDERERSTQSGQGTIGLTLAPLKTLTANGSYSYQWSQGTGGGAPPTTSHGQSLSGSATWSPYPALFFAGSILRTWIEHPSTLVSFSAGFSPLRDGQLQLSLNYGETYESATQRRSRTYGTSIRWNFRPGYYLEASLGESRLYSPVVNSVADSFFVSMYLPLL